MEGVVEGVMQGVVEEVLLVLQLGKLDQQHLDLGKLEQQQVFKLVQGGQVEQVVQLVFVFLRG